MRPRTAAAYLDISVSTFLVHVAPSVPPVHMTPRIKAYMRVDLDAWALMRQGTEHVHTSVFNKWHVPFDKGVSKPVLTQNIDNRMHRGCSTDVWDETYSVWVRPPPRLYPVSILEQKLLAHLSDGLPGKLPKGVSIGTVNRLEDRGWIERAEKPDDSRHDKYVLTEAGLAQTRSPDGVTVAPNAQSARGRNPLQRPLRKVVRIGNS